MTRVSSCLRQLAAIAVLLTTMVSASVVMHPTTARAASTYYVATSGNDASGTGSSAKPWKTIQKAADSVGPGATVLIKPGTYTQAVVIEIAASSGSPVTFRGDGAGVVINASGVDRDAVLISESSYVTWENIRIQNAPRAGLRVSASNHVTVRDNVFANNQRWGLFTDFSDDLVIEGNESFGATIEHGIYFSNSGDRPIIRGNVIHDNHANGLHMNGDASMGGDGVITSPVVEGNVIYNNGVGGGSGINMDGVQSAMVRNNLIYNTHASGISMYQIDGGLCSRNNKIYHNTIIVAADGRWAINIPQGECTGNKLISNILYSNHSYRGAINLADGAEAGFQSDYNVLEGTFTRDDGDSILSLSQWQGQGFDTHSKVATPSQLFVNVTNDFHLKAGSPAIDAGQTLSSIKTDLAGTVRPQGTSSDAGAYESSSSAAKPDCKISPGSGVVYTKVTMDCTGFKSSEVISLAWDGAPIASKTASSGGAATLTFSAPRGVTGRHLVKATGNMGSVAPSRGFRIAPSILSSPTGGVGGQVINVTLRGFGNGEVIRIRFRTAPGSSRTVRSGVVASSTGTATTTFTVPTGPAGTYAIEATGSAAGFASAVFRRIIGTAEEPTFTATATATQTATATATIPI
ncbi:MAG TPA: right-handed parallel beta-helix repeat-containing protein, partial [Thermomicrobiales bacterium]|nr:right-handed parallel beta-helix repeat-containing protein [Thermomicrobiales bacterium]